MSTSYYDSLSYDKVTLALSTNPRFKLKLESDPMFKHAVIAVIVEKRGVPKKISAEETLKFGEMVMGMYEDELEREALEVKAHLAREKSEKAAKLGDTPLKATMLVSPLDALQSALADVRERREELLRPIQDELNELNRLERSYTEAMEKITGAATVHVKVVSPAPAAAFPVEDHNEPTGRRSQAELDATARLIVKTYAWSGEGSFNLAEFRQHIRSNYDKTMRKHCIGCIASYIGNGIRHGFLEHDPQEEGRYIRTQRWVAA